MWRKGIPCALLVGLQIGIATVENSMEGPQKIKNGTALWPSNPSSGYIAKGNKLSISKGYLDPHVLCSILHIAKTWKQAKCLSTDEWMDKETVVQPWLVWFNGLSAGLRTKGLPAQFPVRACAWVASQVIGTVHARGNHTLMFLSLSPSRPLCLKINK